MKERRHQRTLGSDCSSSPQYRKLISIISLHSFLEFKFITRKQKIQNENEDLCRSFTFPDANTSSLYIFGYLPKTSKRRGFFGVECGSNLHRLLCKVSISKQRQKQQKELSFSLILSMLYFLEMIHGTVVYYLQTTEKIRQGESSAEVGL